jgi:choline transport protein
MCAVAVVVTNRALPAINTAGASLVIAAVSDNHHSVIRGSSTAFNAFTGSFMILSTCSYRASILPHILSRRANAAPNLF